MSRARFSPSSSAAGSSSSSAERPGLSCSWISSCASINPAATSFCWPRDTWSLAGRPPPQDDHVGAMRAELRGPVAPIAAAIGGEGAGKWLVAVPTGLVDEGDRLIEQCSADGFKRRREAGEIVVPLLGEGFATRGELLFPGRQVLIAGVLLQRRVPLAQGLVVAPPGWEEGMFHVEHAVEIPPAPARTFLKQLVHLGVDAPGPGTARPDLRCRPPQRRRRATLNRCGLPERPVQSGRPRLKPCPRAKRSLRRAQSAHRVDGCEKTGLGSGRTRLRAGWSCLTRSGR